MRGIVAGGAWSGQLRSRLDEGVAGASRGLAIDRSTTPRDPTTQGGRVQTLEGFRPIPLSRL
jgi:hypothetical protein